MPPVTISSSHTTDDTLPGVLVLLPVYNGERFLTEQVTSVLAQTGVRVHILCRDDGSRDASRALLHELQLRHNAQMTVIDDELGNLGASGNFSRLMQLALDLPIGPLGQARYIALSDQDDVWHADKLGTAMVALLQLEREQPGKPALVHSDLRLVTEEGQEIAPSMARYQGLRTELSGFAAQLLSNTLTGCTSLMNRALLEKGLPVPAEAIMHDWWLSLVASSLGARCYLDQPLIDYRQHTSNAIGAKPQDKPVAFKSIFHRLFDDRHGDIFRLNARQARGFLDRFRDELTPRQRVTAWMASKLSVPLPPLQRTIYRILRRL